MNQKLTRYLKGNQKLLLAVCILGVLLTAWWAAAAGPLVPSPSLSRVPSASKLSALDSNAYTGADTIAPSTGNPSVSPAGSGQASGSSANAANGNVSSPVLPPPNTQPSVPNCLPAEAANPDLMYYPCGGCGYNGDIASYPCCQNGTRYVCGCGGTPKADVMCPL